MKAFTTFAALMLLASATAKRYVIDPKLKSGEGGDFEVDCLLLVEPGDECYLLDGDHKHDGLTRVHGTADKRITIRGESFDACIRGSNTQDRALQIAHNYYTLENLCFNGQHGDQYVSTAVYVLGADKASASDETNGVKSSVTGLQMFNLEIKNWDEECVHLRYFVTFTEIRGCTIQRCGMHSFANGGGGSVGEGVYVGTALDQVKDGKTPEPKLRTASADKPEVDVTQYNWIHENTIRTYGNECVDVKEGSTNNLIENNVCEQQKDENSGCMGSRGSGNTFRYNKIAECIGAGVRVGGDKGFGGDNNIYGNTISNAEYGGFNVMHYGQGMVCGNALSGVDVVTQGAEKDYFETDRVIGSCDGNDTPGDIDYFKTRPSKKERKQADEIAVDEVNAGSETTDASVEEESTTSSSQDEVDASTPLEEEEDEEGPCAGVNCADLEEQEKIPEKDKIFEIRTNSVSGTSSNGGCKVVVPVIKLKANHKDNMDPTTDPSNLFDGDVSSYFSVNRESTFHVLELEQEAEINGVSIGFFMKAASEERIQVFDVAVRGIDDEEFTTVISRKESSGAMHDVQYFAFTSPVKAQYVKIESHGNSFNNWTAFTEIEICGAEAESNALFGGVRAVKKEIAELAGGVCTECTLLAPVKSKVTGRDNVKEIFDGNFNTRWSTQATQAKNDLDNAKISATFLGEQHVCHVDIAFFDGHLARPHFSMYKQSAHAATWSPVLVGEIGSKSSSFQRFDIQETGVNTLYIVGNGNDLGDFSKVSELRIYGC